MTGSNTLIFGETKVKDGNSASLLWHFSLWSYYNQLSLHYDRFVLLSVVTMALDRIYRRLFRPVRNGLLLFRRLDYIFRNGSLFFFFLANSTLCYLGNEMWLWCNAIIFGTMALCSVSLWRQKHYTTKISANFVNKHYQSINLFTWSVMRTKLICWWKGGIHVFNCKD